MVHLPTRRNLFGASGISKPKYGASREISQSAKPASNHSSNLFAIERGKRPSSRVHFVNIQRSLEV